MLKRKPDCENRYDQYQAIAAEYGVRSVPTLLIFKKGELLFRQSGVMDVNSLTAELKKHI